jgi:hypothetical protein
MLIQWKRRHSGLDPISLRPSILISATPSRKVILEGTGYHSELG